MQLQAQPPQPKRGKIWGQEQPKTKMVHHRERAKDTINDDAEDNTWDMINVKEMS